MPTTIANLSRLVSNRVNQDVSAAINDRSTAPRVGTTRRNNRHVHGATLVRTVEGFRDGLRHLRTVADLKDHLAGHVRLDGARLDATRFVIYGPDDKALHGATHIA